MFRKLVSNLSFSPALITQVSFYARRLRREETTRRLTIIFFVLTLLIQSLAVFSPPDSANASNEQDLIRGGVNSLDDLLARYDRNSDDIKDIYSSLGLTRDEIVRAQPGTINSKDNIYSVTRYAQYGSVIGETRFAYKRSAGGVSTRYISMLSLSDTTPEKQRTGTTYDAWVGQSAKLGWFALIKSNASIATKGYPSTATPDSSAASSTVTRTVESYNMTQQKAASDTPAQPFDRISYTVSVHNSSKSSIQLPISVNLADSLEYSLLIDDGGASLDNKTNLLTWQGATIAPGTTEKRTYIMQLFSTIPATAVGTSNANSYDCTLSTSFGNNVKIPVVCPVAKGVERTLQDLPVMGIATNIVFSLIIGGVIIYFYIRTRQLKNEIRLIRHNLNVGSL